MPRRPERPVAVEIFHVDDGGRGREAIIDYLCFLLDERDAAIAEGKPWPPPAPPEPVRPTRKARPPRKPH